MAEREERWGEGGEEMGQYGRASLLDFIQISSSRHHVGSIEKGSQHGVAKENAKHAIPKEKIELRNK